MSTDPLEWKLTSEPSCAPRLCCWPERGHCLHQAGADREGAPGPRAFRWEAARRHRQQQELTKAATCSRALSAGLNLLEG